MAVSYLQVYPRYLLLQPVFLQSVFSLQQRLQAVLSFPFGLRRLARFEASQRNHCATSLHPMNQPPFRRRQQDGLHN